MGPDEECDDGNPIDSDGCDNACVRNPSFRIIFVSSRVYTGNLGGVSGADDLCQQLADDAGLAGTYLAWISDTTSPSTRFTPSTNPYMLPSGALIADNWTDLTDGTLARAINMTETFSAPTVGTLDCGGAGAPSVWTNTTFGGGSQGAMSSCDGWTSTAGTGIGGRADATDGTWSTACTGQACSLSAALYCVQQ